MIVEIQSLAMQSCTHRQALCLTSEAKSFRFPMQRVPETLRRRHSRVNVAASTSITDMGMFLQESILLRDDQAGVPFMLSVASQTLTLANISEVFPESSPTVPPVPDTLPGLSSLERPRPSAAEAESVSAVIDGAKEILSDAGTSVTDALSDIVHSASRSLSLLQDSAAGAASSVTDTLSGMDRDSSVHSFAPPFDTRFQGRKNGTAQSSAHVNFQPEHAGSLPEPIQQALTAAAHAAQPVVEAAAADPATSAAVAAGLVLLPYSIAAYQRFAGYAGDLAALEASFILQNEDAVLVDIRGDEVRSRYGVPDLQRGATGKGIAVPLLLLQPAVAQRLKKADDVSVQITAATIANLRQLQNRRTVVILMDGGDGRAIAVAKALRASGCQRPYALEGGFRSWVAADLPVEVGAPNYQVPLVKRIGNETEILAERAISRLENPSFLIGTTVIGSLAGLAILDWHLALQFIGSSALLFSVAGRISSYNSPQDALLDVQEGYKGIEGVIGGPIQFAKRLFDKTRAAEASSTLVEPAQKTFE